MVPVLGRSDDVAITVVDFHPSAFLRFKMDLPPLMPIYTMSFIEGRDGGTDVEWVAESRNHTGWFGGVVLPMTRLIWQYREDQMVEHSAALAPAAASSTSKRRSVTSFSKSAMFSSA